MTTRNDFLKMLTEHTHSLFTSEIVTQANDLFGTRIKARTYRANPHDPKGLTLDNGKAVSDPGISALDLSRELCDALRVKYPHKMGRGFQVRACVDALREAGFG